MSGPRRTSLPSCSTAVGEVVLCNLPPYSTQPWLSMGVVLHYALLEAAGIRARVVRPLASPFAVPWPVEHASSVTFTFNPSMDQRLAAMQAAYDAFSAFFDGMVDALLDGPEQIVALSLFRNNADVSIWTARLIKEKRPSCHVILAGPEAIEDPELLLLPWIDAVVGADAESVFISLVKALLEGQAAKATALRHVWLNPRVATGGGDPRRRVAAPSPTLPVIDYRPLMPLFSGDPEATVPLLLNWGCPYNCSFCSNRSVYSRFTLGSVDRLLLEMDSAVEGWKTLDEDSGLTLQLSDATTNAIPAQFDELLQGVIARHSTWGARPMLRGQTLFDARITPERVRLMTEGHFGSTFFGLESGSDDLRRLLKKPAGIAQVAEAMEAYHRGGGGGLHFGVPVGLPGETEAHFAETERFVEWSLGLTGTIESITVLPYVFFRSAQDPALLQLNTGEPRGVLWKSSGPGGDPTVRAKRMMRLFDRIDGRVACNSPIPPYLALPAMLGPTERDEIEPWLERHGRAFDQITPHRAKTLQRRISDRLTGPDRRWHQAAKVFESMTVPGWSLEGFVHRGDAGTTQALVVLFKREPTGRFALVLEPLDPDTKAYTRTADFNASYLQNWDGSACVFDGDLMRWCVHALGAPRV